MGISAEAIWGLAEILNREVDARNDVSNAMVTRIDVDGKAWVRLDGASIDTPANGGTRVTIAQNDAVLVSIKNGVCTITNNRSYPNATASDIGTVNVNVNQLDEKTMQNFNAVNGVIENLEVDTAKIHSLTGDQLAFTVGIFDELTADELDANKMTALVGFFTDLTVTNEVTAEQITATTGFYDTLTANDVDAQKVTATTGFYDTLTANDVDAGKVTAGVGFYDTLNANNVDANKVIAGAGYYDTLTANSVTAADIVASTGYVNDLTTNHITAGDLVATKATVDDLDVNYAHVTNGKIDTATIDYANVENLAAHYADIDLANVNNAWIENGVLRRGSIADAQIASMSATKLTAGTINAGVIRVINLDAANITVGTLNGERIGNSTLSLDKLSERVYTEDEIDQMLAAMSARIDSAIQTFTGPDVPLLTNYPASDWTTATVRAEHVGDIYYVVNSGGQAEGYSYRFVYDRMTDTYSWTLIQDTAITGALQRILDLEGDMQAVKSFDSSTASWMETTDSSITRVIANHTALETVVGGTLQSSVQLWKATETRAKPLGPVEPFVNEGYGIVDEYGYAIVTDGGYVIVTDGSAAEWTTEIPEWDSQRPYYWYCWQYQYTDDTYSWSEPVYDSVTTEAQSTARATSTALGSYITSNDEAIAALQDQLDGSVDIWYVTVDPTTENYPASGWDADTKALRVGDLCYNTTTGHSFRFVADGSSYSWIQIPDTDAAAALAAAQDALATADGRRRVFTTTPTVPYDVGDLWVTGSEVRYATHLRADDDTYHADDWSLTATDDAMAAGNVKSTTQLWFTKANGSLPAKPTTHITTNDASVAGDWNRTVPTWNEDYPYYFYCFEYQKGDGGYSWGDVVYDRATTESQRNVASALDQVSTKVEVQTFNELSETVDGVTRTITQLSTTVEGKADGSTVTTLSNTVSTVSDTVEGHTRSISNLTTTVNGNGDVEGLVSRASALEQTVEGLDSTVKTVEAWGEDGGRLKVAESKIQQHDDAISLRATKTEVEGAQAAADSAMEEAQRAFDAASGLIYDHTYTHENDVYTFVASLHKGGVDITDEVDPNLFVWFLKNEDGEDILGRGRTWTIAGADVGYRGVIIGGYDEYGSYVLVDDNDWSLVTDTGVELVAHIAGFE